MEVRSRALLGCALVLLTACTGPSFVAPTPTPSREPGTLSVTALLELSGPRASVGKAQRNALQLWTDQQQARGTRQLRVRWRTVDVAASEARAVIELHRAAEEGDADAIVLGTPLYGYSDALLRAIELAEVPVLLTLPAPEPPRGGGRWLFALAPPPDRLDALVAADLDARGITDPPFRLAPRDADAIRHPAQLAGVQALRLGGTPKDYPLLANVLRRIVPVPVAYFSYLSDPNDLGDFKDAALAAVWPGSRHVVGGAPPEQSPARREFARAYGDRHGPPGTWAATAFDALALAAAAVERSAGAGERSAAAIRESIRDRLEDAPVVGIATTYAFSRSSHSGPLADDFVLLRWSGSAVSATGR